MMSDQLSANDDSFAFVAPGPGEWMLDTTHHGRRPVSGFLRHQMIEQFESGMSELFVTYGLPLATIEGRLVEGCLYARPKAVGEGSKPSPTPPALILKIVTRLHPEFRRRNKAATRAWAEKRWRRDVDDWFDRDREPTVARLSELQRVAVDTLDDEALLAHLETLNAELGELMRLGMATHGGDIMPNGDYFAHCEKWGIDTGEAAELLRGSSPASSEAARLLAPVADAIAGADPRPTSIDEVRAITPEVASTIDRWLELFGWRVIDSDDLDGTTLAESPELQLAALLAAARPEGLDDVPDPSSVRAQVPEGSRALFDELLTEARYGLRLRDDNVGVRWCWPVGLTRRALLEVGSRLVAQGRIVNREHAIELDPSEVAPLLRDHTGPTADDLGRRAARRLAVEAAGPPSKLGEPEAPPPIEAMPAAMARATAAMLAMIDAMEGTKESDGAEDPGSIRGVGVGDRSYRGTARVVSGADDAFARLSEGDVLVAPFTGPAYNSVLAIVGAVVVDEGGPLCHAAIVSRELGVPSIIGATGASSEIPDGAEVEVDPVAGLVRIL